MSYKRKYTISYISVYYIDVLNRPFISNGYIYVVENSPPIVFRPIHRRRPSTQNHRNDKRSGVAVQPIRRGPRTVAWRYRCNGAHRSRVVRAVEHNKSAERSAHQTRCVDQGPKIPERSYVQHAGKRADGNNYGAFRSGFHQTL